MNETLQVLKTRRSIRMYKAEQITDAELNAILEAGLHSVQQQLKAKPLPYRLFCILVFAVY